MNATFKKKLSKNICELFYYLIFYYSPNFIALLK